MPGSSAGNESGTARSAALWFLLLLALFACLYILPLSLRPLLRPDEIRYAEITREMRTSGDWVSPRFNGVHYFEKPVLGYWINSASVAVLGESNFAIRLPSALATLATGLFIFLLTRVCANPRAAMFAAGIFLTSLEAFAIGTTAMLDSMLTLFLSLTIGANWLALRSDSQSRRNRFLAVSGFACGCAFLTKGFLALVLPALVAGAFLVREGQWRKLLTTIWLPLAVALLVALPWTVAIAIREPDFWQYFFWVEHVRRFVNGEAQHLQPWWYYLPWLPAIAFPWTFLLGPAISGLRRATPDRGFVRYLLCWLIAPLVFFSLSQGKAANYLLPCLVPFAVLLGMGLERSMAAHGRLQLRWSALGLAAVPIGALIVLAVAQYGDFVAAPYGPEDSARYALLLAVLGASAIAAAWAWRCVSARMQLLLVGLTALPFFLALTVIWPQREGDDRGPTQFVIEQAGNTDNAILVADPSLFGTMSWALRRTDVYVIDGGEIKYGLTYPEAAFRQLDDAGLKRLIHRNSGRRDILILCDQAMEKRIHAMLPAAVASVRQGSVFFLRIPAAAVLSDG